MGALSRWARRTPSRCYLPPPDVAHSPRLGFTAVAPTRQSSSALAFLSQSEFALWLTGIRVERVLTATASCFNVACAECVRAAHDHRPRDARLWPRRPTARPNASLRTLLSAERTPTPTSTIKRLWLLLAGVDCCSGSVPTAHMEAFAPPIAERVVDLHGHHLISLFGHDSHIRCASSFNGCPLQRSSDWVDDRKRGEVDDRLQRCGTRSTQHCRAGRAVLAASIRPRPRGLAAPAPLH